MTEKEEEKKNRKLTISLEVPEFVIRKKKELLTVVLVLIAFGAGFYTRGITGEVSLPVAGPTLTIINDPTCKMCDTSNIIDVTKQLFPDVEVKNIDSNSADGKNLISRLGITALPAYLFDESVTKQDSYQQVSGAFIKTGEFYVIDPRQTGAGYLIGREKTPGDLKLFVMSQCPYGVQAEKAMEEVLQALGDQIDFSIHFIADENPDGTFSSLHGQKEVDEDIRQVCAMKHYPDKYFDYILCQYDNYKAGKDFDETWEDCAKDKGMSVSNIKSCAEGDEGKQMLSENIAVTNELGISSSPTFLANNQMKFSGIDAKTILNNVCQLNEGLEGCDVEVSGSSGVPAGQC